MSCNALYLAGADIRHDTPYGHPENAGRLTAFLQGVFKPEARDLELVRCATAPILVDDLTGLHDAAYVQKILDLNAIGGALDPDTHMSVGSGLAALHSAGGAVDATRRVLSGDHDTAFVATRPPGHHALADKAMGFCFFGNAALAAKAAIHQGARVAVLDFDVHHGNGTQALLWDEPNAFFASTHQLSAWPQTGRKDEIGAHDTIRNRPLKSGAGSRLMREAWTDLLEEAGRFSPDIVIVSAGFDAHQHDKMGGFSWQTGDYAFLGKAIREMAQGTAQGRVVSLLEGGYEQSVLRQSGRAYLENLIFG